MTIIVSSPKEKLLLADHFIFNYNDVSKSVSEISLELGVKIKFNEEKTIAYVFGGEQINEVLPLVFAQIEMYEKSTLPKDNVFKLEGEKFDDISIELYLMTARHFYFLKKPAKNTTGELEVHTYQRCSSYSINTWLNVLDLPAKVVFEVCRESDTTLATADYQIVYQKELKKIPVKPVRKAKVEGATK